MNHIRHIYHIILRTKGSLPAIPETAKSLVIDRIIHVCSRKENRVYAVNSFLNHVHILVEVSIKGNIPELINKVKTSLYTRMKDNPDFPDFTGWCAGYDSFTVEYKNLNRWTNHIAGQRQWHISHSFEEEYNLLLTENGFKPVSLKIKDYE